MKKIKKAGYILLQIIALLLATFSIFSIFRDTENRYLKLLDFPRIQFFVASLIFLAIGAIVIKNWQWFDYLLLLALFCGLLVNGYYLINYTKLVSEDVPTAKGIKNTDFSFSLLIANVKMNNRTAQPLLNLIKKKNPDLLLAMEVDEWWDQQFKSLKKEYPYSISRINSVAYGMILFSKYPMKSIEINYLQNEKVPSFESIVTLTDGKNISFHGVHPVPPTHFKKLPDNKGQQETALKKIGRKLMSNKYPSLIAGDMNDVVWSHVDELTETNKILKDVRVGRGFYNSYNANNIFMRWPLDHIFVTEEFRLKKLERLSNIGSDHFPIFVELVL